MDLENTVIKRMGFVKRKPGMTLGAFHDHWLNVHAPLAAKAPGLRRYIVSTLLLPPGIDYTPAYDGFAEFWYDDLAALETAEASPEWAATRADSPNFIGEVAALFTHEVPIIEDGKSAREREGWVKYSSLLTRKRGTMPEAMQAHWRDVHGPLVAEEFTSMDRYIQCHPLLETYDTPRHPAYDGCALVWFRSIEALPLPLLGRKPDDEPTAAGSDSAQTFELPHRVMLSREHVIVG